MDWLDKIITDAEPTGESPRRRAFALPRLTPYLWDAHLARALCRACKEGSRRILAMTWQWCRTAPHGDRLLRASAPAGVLIGTGWAVYHYPRAGILAVVGAWVGAAVYLAGKEAWTVQARTAPGVEQVPAAPLDAATVARVVRQLADAGGWQGAHLDDVLTHLPGHSRDELLTVLAEAGIPVAEQLKLRLPGGRQRNRQGVRVDALPQGLGQAPSDPAEPPAPGPPERPAEVPPQPLPDRLTTHPQ